MNRLSPDLQNTYIVAYCEAYNLSIPEPWCYSGDLIEDVDFGRLFICGNDPKDVAEVRRRTVSYRKVDLSALRDLENYNKLLLETIETLRSGYQEVRGTLFAIQIGDCFDDPLPRDVELRHEGISQSIKALEYIMDILGIDHLSKQPETEDPF